MFLLPPQTLFFLEAVIFTSVVFLHLVKRGSTGIFLYIAQSTVIALLLIISSFEKSSFLLGIAIIATLAVKIVVAPYFFFSLLKKHHVTFLVGTYFNVPITLVCITALTALTRADIFKQFSLLSLLGKDFLLIPLATILISIFLIINSRGALSQMFGILSLENGIVSFALFAGLEQNPGLQLGITINILIWIIMASMLASMIFKQYGSLDVSAMKRLIE